MHLSFHPHHLPNMTPPHIAPERVHRTPAAALPDILPDLPYRARYATYGNLRYAWLDIDGPVLDTHTGREAPDAEAQAKLVVTETVLCLHGEPSWGYLYRKMIPGFLSACSPRPNAPAEQRYVRRRVLVPDLIGFGRSDKPIDDDVYTFGFHRDWLIHFVTKHIVDDARTAQGGRVTLAVQDWGGLLGLLLPMLFPDVFGYLIVMNTGLGLGKPPTKGWLEFRDYMQRTPDCNIGALLKRGTPLSKHEQAMYDAPFVAGQVSKAGVRAFPRLVPITPQHRGAAESHAALAYYMNLPAVAHRSNREDASAPQAQGLGARVGQPLRVFVACGMKDPVLGAVMRPLANKAWGGIGYHWHPVPEGGHFVQEWCEYLPALVEQAWATADPTSSGKTQHGPHVVEYVAPQSPAKL